MDIVIVTTCDLDRFFAVERDDFSAPVDVFEPLFAKFDLVGTRLKR